MDDRTAERLLSLNRAFYTTFAQEFAASRSDSDPALVCILPYVPQGARLLDIGCGNGRLALLLERERPGAAYLGLDSVPDLIEQARARAAHVASISAEFRIADVAQPGWSSVLRGARFDTVASLAVIHHMPGHARRARVLREMTSSVAHGGRIILSAWQFLGSERLRRKIVAWSEVGITDEELEPGDYLLDWKRGGRGLRYCHLIDPAEAECLAAEADLTVQEMFRAGGREGNLSLYVVMEKRHRSQAHSPWLSRCE